MRMTGQTRRQGRWPMYGARPLLRRARAIAGAEAEAWGGIEAAPPCRLPWSRVHLRVREGLRRQVCVCTARVR